jgi:regulator of replication initiation timing
MFAVREEVDVLKEKIVELLDRIQVLEHENNTLRNNVPPDVLSSLNPNQQPAQQQANNNTQNVTNQQQQASQQSQVVLSQPQQQPHPPTQQQVTSPTSVASQTLPSFPEADNKDGTLENKQAQEIPPPEQ